MKKTFNIEVKETIKDTFEIEAENTEEAEYLAEKGYYDGKYVLDGIDAESRDISFTDTNSPHYISDKRKQEILDELIDYVSEHTTDEKDFYNALKNIIGLTNSEMTELGIDVKREVIAKEPLQESEITFEDELIIEEDTINAYIPLYNIDIFDKFSIDEREDFEYNMYLDYNIMKDKCLIIIIEKDDSNYIQYQYEPSAEENKMLKEKLNEYCIDRDNQSLQEIIDEKEL